MSKVENLESSGFSRLGERLLESRLADAARGILPEPVRRRVREIIHGQRAQYPLKEPVFVNLAGVEARFWVKNQSDWYRVKANFERGYGETLIGTLAKMDNPSFIDVGSAQGLYAILAAKAGGRVWAIDPDPVSWQSLQGNIGLNPGVGDRIKPMEIALGERVGEMRLYADRTGTYVPSLRKTGPGLKEEIMVPVRTIDELVLLGAIPSPNVVKIDVEGAEGWVINGMRGVLSSPEKPSDIFIELHPGRLPLFGTTEAEVLNLLVQNGYYLIEDWERRNERLCHFVCR